MKNLNYKLFEKNQLKKNELSPIAGGREIVDTDTASGRCKMKTIKHLSSTLLVALLSVTVFFSSCQKDEVINIEKPKVDTEVSKSLADAFAFATNIKIKSGDSDAYNASDIESSMLNYLTEHYGSDIKKIYADNKDALTPQMKDFSHLESMSLDQLDELNIQQFAKEVFNNSKTSLKSVYNHNNLPIYVQAEYDKLMGSIENGIQLFLTESIEVEILDKEKLIQNLSGTIAEYKKTMDINNLTADEIYALNTAIATVENSINDIASFALASSSSIGTKSTKGFFKKLFKSVVKVVVMAVGLVGGTIGGVLLGSLAGPAFMIPGGIAGFVSGAILVSRVNRWADKW